MDKKGVQLSIQAIIVAVLGLVVLFILIFVIRGQIGKGTLKYVNITETAEKEFTGKKCAGFLIPRGCATMEDCSKQGGKVVPGTWDDCQSPNICCERA